MYNYSQANIPLETMWTDIDYMDRRKVFTLDPKRFPIEKVRELVDYLHDHDQHYIVMVDPAVAYSDNGAFNRGVEQDIFLKKADGSIFKGMHQRSRQFYINVSNPSRCRMARCDSFPGLVPSKRGKLLG